MSRISRDKHSPGQSKYSCQAVIEIRQDTAVIVDLVSYVKIEINVLYSLSEPLFVPDDAEVFFKVLRRHIADILFAP